MIVELGHFALVLALLLSLIQAVVPLWGAHRGLKGWMALGRQAAVSTCGLLTIALFALTHAYALSDFSVQNVFENSHTMKPLVYKLTGVWGNHEGSMLLWVWMLSVWGMLAARFVRAPGPVFQARVLAVQGMVSAGFLLFVLCASNPFLRLTPAMPEGLDLNPVLQDPALALHPPLLYAGYVGFSIAFCFAIAALIGGTVGRAWAVALRPWVLAAWSFLTAGIALGSFWAYYELGWGGFWFWDPVENASLMPWLAGTALLHSVLVLERRGAFGGWTVLLAILAFSFSLLGAFLVRSGILTSVHAFATDPTRGIFILALLGLTTGGALLLFALRAPSLPVSTTFAPASRETVLLLNNVFMFTAVTTVFTGTLYPVFLAALDAGSVSVGTPYYMAIFVPLLLPFALLMGAAPAVPWGQAQPRRVAETLAVPMLATIALVLPALRPQIFSGAAGGWHSLPVTAVGFFAGGWILLATLAALLRQTQGLRRWRPVPLRHHAMTLAHAGFALLVLGATAATQGARENIQWMRPGDSISIAGRQVLLVAFDTDLGKNYNIDRAVFSVTQASASGQRIDFLQPEKRWYPVARRMTSEAALKMQGLGVLYIVLGDDGADALGRPAMVVRIYHHPLVSLIFIGALLMALGGVLAAAVRGKPRPSETDADVASAENAS